MHTVMYIMDTITDVEVGYIVETSLNYVVILGNVK